MRKLITLVCLLFPLLYWGCAKEELIQISEENIASKTNTKDVSSTSRNNGNLGEEYNSGYRSPYYWGVWKDRGYAAIEFPQPWNNGTFKLSYWNKNGWNIRDIVGGLGWGNGNGRTITYNYNAWGQWDFIGIYGWACNPRIEYYVVENEGGNGIQGTYKSTYKVGNVTYDFYIKDQRDHHGCGGRSGNNWGFFRQFISKRRGKAPTNTDVAVNMQKHIDHWNYWSRQLYGYNLNSFGYQKFAIEAFNGKSGGIYATVR